MEIISIEYIEFYVGNAMQAAFYYTNTFGFELIAYKGPENGCRDHVSYVVKQGEILFVFSAPILPAHPISNFLSLHGDAVRSIAFLVDDPKEAWRLAVMNGAKSIQEPIITKDHYGSCITSSVLLYGDIVHTFIQKNNYNGIFYPGYVIKENKSQINKSAGLIQIDHCTSNLEKGKLEEWITYYKKVLGFSEFLEFDDKDIYTDYSAMMTKVVVNKTHTIKLPLIQPIDKTWKSQIQEFVDYNGGPGVQHIALTTNNIVNTIKILKSRGIEFLSISKEYYDEMDERISGLEEDLKIFKGLNIMIDREVDGLIYQAFSKPLVDRPTFFVEIIQRKGAKSFGKGNVKEFFNALTVEQSKRGNA